MNHQEEPAGEDERPSDEAGDGGETRPEEDADPSRQEQMRDARGDQRPSDAEHATGPLYDRATWEARLKEGRRLVFSDLIRLAHWKTLDSQPERSLGDEYYDRALDAFKAAHEGSGPITGGYRLDIAIFSAAGCGVYLPPDARLWYTVMERAIGFDWSEAHLLLNRVEMLARHARELWRLDATLLSMTDPGDAASEGRGLEATAEIGKANQESANEQRSVGKWMERRRSAFRASHARHVLEERRPHCEQAYYLCSSVLSAVNLEKLDRLEHQKGVMAVPNAVSRAPSAGFLKRVDVIRPQLEQAEADFQTAAQRYARGLYARGMLMGTGVLALVCGVLGLIFSSYDVPAWYAVALLGGGLGAIVSVLRRMAKGTLRLEYDAGRRMLVALGAVRPLIGAVFGMVLFAAFDGGWLPSINISQTKPLAFYGVLGFLAGFSERFAQDMLVASAATVGSMPDSGEHFDARSD